jgi:CO dehydrogenase nickel-insertion accessory protein CooC1
MAATENGKPKSNQVHLVLQGKGGVGKRLVSAILGQYFQARKRTLHCFDTDPVNATFAQYEALAPNTSTFYVAVQSTISDSTSWLRRFATSTVFVSWTQEPRRLSLYGTISSKTKSYASPQHGLGGSSCIRLLRAGKP